MGADASIYSLVGQPTAKLESPVDQYSRLLTLKNAQGQNELADLQRSKLTRDMQEEDAFKSAIPGTDYSTPEGMNRLIGISPTRGIQLQKTVIENKKNLGDIAHTSAKTGEIQAGEVAGHLAALTKDPSDQGVQTMADLMASHGIPAPVVDGLKSKILALPIELRAPWLTAQAAGHKNGQEALKILFPAAHMQDTGATVAPVSTSTLPGQAAPGSAVPGGVTVTKTATPGEVMSDATRKSEGAAGRAVTLRGQNMTDARQREMNGILEGQNIDLGPTAKAIANYEVPAPTLRTSTPNAINQYNKLMAAVKAENPEYDSKNFTTSQASLTAFAKGKQGDSTRFISTAADHVHTLRDMADALKNGNVQLFNKVANEFAAQTGGTAPTNFDTAKNIVGGEVVKGIVGAGGGVEDRNKAQAAFDRAKSPAQLSGAIDTVMSLLNGQLKGLEQQYKAGTGRKDFRDKYLTPGARAAFEGIKESPANNPGGLVAAVKTDADYAKLPSGATFKAPDGTTRTKP